MCKLKTTLSTMVIICQQKRKTANAASMLSCSCKPSFFFEMNYDHRDNGFNLNSDLISWKYIFLLYSGEQFVLNLSAHQWGIVLSCVNVKFASLIGDNVFRKAMLAKWWTVSSYTLTEHVLIGRNIAIEQIVGLSPWTIMEWLWRHHYGITL